MIHKINKILYISLCSTIAISIISTVAKSANLLENSNVNRTYFSPQMISDKINTQLSKEDTKKYIILKNLEEYVVDVDLIEENNYITEINLILENNITDDEIKILKIKMEEICEYNGFFNNESTIKVNISDSQSIQESFDIKKSTANTTLKISDNIIITN